MADDPEARPPEQGIPPAITPLGRGRYRISDGTGQRLAYAAGPPDARWVFLDGQVYVIDITGRGGSQRARLGASTRTGRHGAVDDGMALAAPMPATVVAINAEPGQAVSAGDVVIMLEAMKMEVPIKAPRDGVVKSLACRVGDLVRPGTPLLEMA